MQRQGDELPSRPPTRQRSSPENEVEESQLDRQMKEHKTCVSPTACNHEDGRDVRCGTIDAGRNDIAERAPAPAPTQLHEKEQREKVNIRDLANHLILLAFEWLFAKDLLELRRVDKLFQDTSKESSLWKGIALHLWNSAMIDGHEANTAPANISLQASTLGELQSDVENSLTHIWEDGRLVATIFDVQFFFDVKNTM